MVRRLSRASTARAGAIWPARAPRALSGSPRGAAAVGAHGETGSQTLELALLTPGVVLVVLMLVLVALTGADLVGAQTLAREGARAAARGADAHAPVRAAAGGRAVQVQVSPPRPVAGEAVTVTVRLRSRLSERVGVAVWLPGQATMLREPGP